MRKESGEVLLPVTRVGRGWRPGAWSWIRSYDVVTMGPLDCVSGLTVGLLAVPQSLSYALLAGLPPQYGLYSDLQVMYPVFGSSRFLVVGPVAVMSLMAREAMQTGSSEMQEFSQEWVDAVCFLSVMVCFVQLLMYYFGLAGKLSSLLPESAVAGFSSAAAILIASTQLADLVGIEKCKEDGASCTFLGTLAWTLRNLSDANAGSVTLAASSFAVLAAVQYAPKVLPRSHSGRFSQVILPKLGSLVVLLGGICLMAALKSSGKASGVFSSVSIVGHIPSGLPSPRWFPAPPGDPVLFATLVRAAVAMAFVGFAEANAIAKASSRRFGGEQPCEDDEMLALAMCNGFTAWVGGYPVTGSFSRTAINAESGACSPLSTGVAAATVVLVLVFLTPYLALLPRACVAAVVVSAVSRLVDLAEFLRLYRAFRLDPRRRELFIFSSVFLSSLCVGVEAGLLTGVAASFVLGHQST